MKRYGHTTYEILDSNGKWYNCTACSKWQAVEIITEYVTLVCGETLGDIVRIDEYPID